MAGRRPKFGKCKAFVWWSLLAAAALASPAKPEAAGLSAVAIDVDTGYAIAADGHDKVLRVIDPATRVQIRTIRMEAAPAAVAAHPQSKRIMISRDSEPGTYLFSIAVCLAGGAASLWHGLSGRGGRDRPK